MCKRGIIVPTETYEQAGEEAGFTCDCRDTVSEQAPSGFSGENCDTDVQIAQHQASAEQAKEDSTTIGIAACATVVLILVGI